MTILKPALHDSRTASSASGLDASELRYLIAALEGNKSGVYGATDLLVSQCAAGPNLSVDIAPATLPAFIKATTGQRNGVYDLKTDASVLNVAGITSHATLPRVDAVVIQANDPADLGRAGVEPTAFVVAGTATAGADLTNLTNAPGVPADAIFLAYVLMPAAAASITTANIKDARVIIGSAPAAAKTKGKSIVPGEEVHTSGVAYGLMPTPDQVPGLVVPAGAVVRVGFQAMWKESVNNAGFAAIFIGANQLKLAQMGVANPVAQEAAMPGAGAQWAPLATATHGLVGDGTNALAAQYVDNVTTGQIIGVGHSSASIDAPYKAAVVMGWGFCELFVAAGTINVSIQFRATSGTVTVKDRKLWVEVKDYA